MATQYREKADCRCIRGVPHFKDPVHVLIVSYLQIDVSLVSAAAELGNWVCGCWVLSLAE